MPRHRSLRSIFRIDPDVVIAASVVQKQPCSRKYRSNSRRFTRSVGERPLSAGAALRATPQRTESIVRHAKCVVNRVRLCNELRLDRTGDDKAAFLGGRQREHQFAV